jgi:hypothetical protein
MSAPARADADRRALARQVLEAMGQDCGPADCEPYTGWCIDLARDVNDLLDRLDELVLVHTRQEEALRGAVATIKGINDWRPDDRALGDINLWHQPLALARYFLVSHASLVDAGVSPPPVASGTPWGPEHPSYDEMGQ